jgi:hypothetical protein
VSRDFFNLVFFIFQFPPPPPPGVSHKDRFKLGPAAKLLPVSLTPAANLPLVLTTPAANFATSVNDTGGKFATSQRQILETISDCRHLQVNLKAKIYIYVNSTTPRCPNKIIKNCLIEDFFHLPPVSLTPVGHFELQKSPRMFGKI